MLLLVAAAPLAAVKLKLKSEAQEFEAATFRLDGDTVTYTKGRKEFTAKLDDFEPASAFEIKLQFTREDGREWLQLANFALHRGLYGKAAEMAPQAVKLDPSLDSQAQRIARTARMLQADALLEQAADLLNQQKVPEARAALQQVIEQFADTPSRIEAEVLLGTLGRVELELKARELEEAARKAQEEADADEGAKRKSVDDWLNELERQVEAQGRTKLDGDRENIAGHLQRGLPIYENVVKALVNIRKKLAENRNLYTFRGQTTQADKIDASAKGLIVDSYERWIYYLYKATRYETAAGLCNIALRIAPDDRRLLSLKVDIDEMYDPLQK
jgi:tetratricopeptide (TPR) repeat protein